MISLLKNGYFVYVHKKIVCGFLTLEITQEIKLFFDDILDIINQINVYKVPLWIRYDPV